MIGSLFGSVNSKASKELRHHQRNNPALIKAKRRPIHRFLNHFLFRTSLLGYFLLYLFILLATYADGYLVRKLWPAFSFPNWGFFTKNEHFIAAQVTALGIIFPIAVGLVTVIAQKNNESNNSSDVAIYYNESMAYRIGASCVALVVVLLLNLFLADSQLWQYVTESTDTAFVGPLLSTVHLAWLIVNFIALWFFLETSLSFVQPNYRARLRREYAANHAIPLDIKRALMQAHYYNSTNKLPLLKNDETADDPFSNGPEVVFGYSWDAEATEATVFLNSEMRLADVWMTPVLWVAKRWLQRSRAARQNHNNVEREMLVFPVMPAFSYSGEIALCTRIGSTSLTKWERVLVKISFRFKRVQ